MTSRHKYDRNRKTVVGDYTVYMGVNGGWIHVPTGWADDDAALDAWDALEKRYPMSTHVILGQSVLAHKWGPHIRQLIRDSHTGRFDARFLQIMQKYDADFKRESERQKREDPFVAVSSHLFVRVSELANSIRDGSLTATQARRAQRALDEWNSRTSSSSPPSGRRPKRKR